METILVAESDETYLKMISSIVSDAGYYAFEATSHLSASSILKNKLPSLMILSWTFKSIGGLEFLSSIKNNEELSWIPVITLHNTEYDSSRVESLRIGAEDCLSKPLDPNELILRIKSIIKRHSTNIAKEGTIQLHGLVLDTNSLRINGKSKSTYLSMTDYQLLFELMTNPGEVYTRSQLKNIISNMSDEADERLIDVHIMRLRRLLKDIGHTNLIQTVRGVGYRIID